MESCAICGKTTLGKPHIQCAKCGSVVCYPCGKDKPKCPICGYTKGRT